MTRHLIFLLLLMYNVTAYAQQVIPLYNGAAPGSEQWDWQEQSTLNGKVVYNISHPTLTMYRPDPTTANGTAVIICPGGGFYYLGITDEGEKAAQWLAQKGVTAFVLKYRTAHSLTTSPMNELGEATRKGTFKAITAPIIELGIADGRAAIQYVREHAAEYNIEPARVGILGFSAGGTVAVSTAYHYNAADKPDFVGAVYPYIPAELQDSIAADAPPLFIAAATNDDLGLTPQSVMLYSRWIAAKHPAEMHLYEKGGHGFGMEQRNTPTDHWIDRYGDWLGVNGLLKAK